MMTVRDRAPGMLLSELLRGLVDWVAQQDISIQRLSMDSRDTGLGDLFIAVPGLTVDGRAYIDDAIARGAAAVIWQCETGTQPIPIHWRNSASGKPLPVIAIDDLTHKVGVIADRFYAAPSKSLYTIGVTGTNGKTSTSQFIAQALGSGKPCAIMGTMGWGLLPNLQPSTHTTPDALSCHRQLAALREQGARAVAMEVSSHALDQGRVNGVHFDCAVFTNLTHDHLDYHGDMQSYAEAKARLFHWPEIKTLVINRDDAFGRELIERHAGDHKLFSYGMDKSQGVPELFADQVHCHDAGMSFNIHTPFGHGQLEFALYGQFNIYNLLATLGVLLDSGLGFDAACAALQQVQSVPGRMQVSKIDNGPVVIIDYAHSPDALQQLLSATAAHRFGQIWLVFGCGGDRDKAKRPVMGAIADNFANQVILTNDNPRHEDPQRIIEEIRTGMGTKANLLVESDRRQAIGYALQHAGAGDVVVIAGKGHETYQQIGDRRLPFSDAGVVKDWLSGAQA